MQSLKKITFALLSTVSLQAMDNAHFYRGSIFWGEPRLKNDLLTTFDVLVGGGSDCKACNCEGEKTSLLNIFGLHNMHRLGQAVPNLDPTNPLDAIVINLNELPDNGDFGELKFGGRFSMEEARIDIQQNLGFGIFTHLNLPIRHLRIKKITFNDQSPNIGPGPNSSTPVWQEFLKNFNAILARHHLYKGDSNTLGVGDFSWTVGWTLNYNETTFLDFIDLTIQAGVLFPTGKAYNPHHIFELPTGYNKHWGFPINLDISVGIWEWLTVGMNSGIMPFLPREEFRYMKTAVAQNGFIKLASGCADVHQGLLWHIGFFGRIDHITQRASFIFGYSHAQKNRDRLYPKNHPSSHSSSERKSTFVTNVVNTDSMLLAWSVKTFHFVFEYDLAKEGQWYHPYIMFFIDMPTGGKRNFDTTFGGAEAGINLTWVVV